jgi:hypothetical protein
METIIGLGNTGCNIAEKFEKYPQYNIHYVDSASRKYKNFIKVDFQVSIEAYEDKYTPLDFSKISGPTCLIVGGSGAISGIVLRILDQLKHLPLYVLYIRPDLDVLTETAQKRERVVFGVLQQYARSALLEKIYIVDNVKVDNAIGEVSIKNYWDAVNDTIVYTIHMINVFDNTEPEMTTFSSIVDTVRIATLGVLDLDSGEEKLFFDLQSPREKLYYYAINKKSLESESNLFKKITNQVKSHAEDNVRSSYAIYSTEHNENYVYTVHYASLVQREIIS